MTVKKLVREIPIRKSERHLQAAIIEQIEKGGLFCETNCKGIKVFALEEICETANQG